MLTFLGVFIHVKRMKCESTETPFWRIYCLKIFDAITEGDYFRGAHECTANKINEDLNILYDKLFQNKLKLNVDKNKVMIISNKKI